MFIDKELKKALIKVAIPVALQNLITSLLNMIDTVMIGSLGDRAVAAVGLANQWFFIFTLVSFGITSGSTIYVAQFFGKKDYESLQRPVAYALFLCSAVAIFFYITLYFAYKECTGGCAPVYLAVSIVFPIFIPFFYQFL